MLPRFLQRPDQLHVHTSAVHPFLRADAFPCRSQSNGTASSAKPAAELQPLTQVHAFDVVTKLNASEREALRQALNQFEADSVASKLEGELWDGRAERLKI